MKKRIIFYLIGLLIASLGVNLVIKSDIGAGPWDAVFIGLVNLFGLTPGFYAIVMQVVMMLINACLLRKRPEFESVITIIAWGLFVDFWFEIVFRDVTVFNLPLYLNWIVFFVGLFLISVGIGLYLTSDLPKNPYDRTMLAVSERFKLNLTVSRTILEALAVLLAFILGGPIGLGTIVIMILIGYIINVCYKFAREVFLKI